MLYALDGMQELMTGEEIFDRDLYDDIVSCFDLFDPGLMAAQDAEWAGIMDYAATGGTADDPWLRCDDEVGRQDTFSKKGYIYVICSSFFSLGHMLSITVHFRNRARCPFLSHVTMHPTLPIMGL